MTENCIKCGVELILGVTFTETILKHHGHICRDCYNKRQRERARRIRELNGIKPRNWRKNKPPCVNSKIQLKNRTEILLQTGAIEGIKLYNMLKNEFGGNYNPSQVAFIQICIADRQHRFIYENKVMRLRTALEIQEYLVEHEIVGCAK
jgi:hypothetical protein